MFHGPAAARNSKDVVKTINETTTHPVMVGVGCLSRWLAMGNYFIRCEREPKPPKKQPEGSAPGKEKNMQTMGGLLER